LCLLVFSGTSVAQDDAPPGSAEQERILTLMRQYAAKYQKTPDVAFDQTLTSFRGRIGSDAWQEEWKNDQSRIAHDGRVYLCCLSRKKGKWRVDTNPIAAGGRQYWTEAWSLPGHTVFPWDGSKATVVWDRWDTRRDHRLAVFNYSVSQRDSHYLVTTFPNAAKIPHSGDVPYSGPVTEIHDSANAPYSGSVWVDPATGSIWRCSDIVKETPARFRTRYASNVEDFDQFTIGTTEYLLLVARVEVVRTKVEMLRGEWAYRNYHKFDADSSITFFGTDSSITYRH
jgi:hypothetical protein